MNKINKEKVNYVNTRISKLRDYLIEIIEGLLTSKSFQINADMLADNPFNYSLDKIPTASVVETLVTGQKLCRDVYSFRARMYSGQEYITNLTNIGFFEVFEQIIKTNNSKGILPKIDGIENIECLNCGSLNSATDNTAEFDIQLQITYREEEQ